jgi:IS30 family transposase
MPKGTKLTEFSQDDLNDIALSLNTRPRRRLHWRTPLEVYTEIIQLDQSAGGTEH